MSCPSPMIGPSSKKFSIWGLLVLAALCAVVLFLFIRSGEESGAVNQQELKLQEAQLYTLHVEELQEEVEQALYRLSDSFPLNYGYTYTVEVLDLETPRPGLWADSEMDHSEKVFKIRVDDDMDPDDWAWELMGHEWSHGMVWDVQNPGDSDHHAAWGRAYAACYRTLFE